MKARPFDPDPKASFSRPSNAMWDVIMPRCTPSEWMILSFIYRKTIGFRKGEDQLTYQQFTDGTGIRGRATIRAALLGLLTKNYITQRGKRRGEMWYGLNQALELDIETSSEIELDDSVTSSEIEPVTQKAKSHLVQKLNYTSSEIELDKPNLVQKLNTPKDKLLKTKENTTTRGDSQYSKCFIAYQENIGKLKPLQIDDFGDLYDTILPPEVETKFEWFEYSILAAVNNNSGNWAYTRAVLEKISRAGSLTKHKEQRNGQTATNRSQQQPAGQTQTGRDQKRPPRVSIGDTDETGIDHATNAKLYDLFGR